MQGSYQKMVELFLVTVNTGLVESGPGLIIRGKKLANGVFSSDEYGIDAFIDLERFVVVRNDNVFYVQAKSIRDLKNCLVSH